MAGASPVVVDGLVSDERLSELAALQAEYPELDYKSRIDLATTEGKVELAKDVGAMQVRGGYIVVGVDDQGQPTGDMDGATLAPFDEANLTQTMQRWLPSTIELRTRVAERDGHVVVLICVVPHSSGCAFFVADGLYEKGGKEKVAFRARDVFWREGTRSVRMSQAGLEEVIALRIDSEKRTWLEEQRDIRRQEREDLESAYQGRQLTDAPLGAVNLDLANRELTAAALEFVRRGDVIGIEHVLRDAAARARQLIDRGETEAELGDLLDKLICLAATFLDYGQADWFKHTVNIVVQIYVMPLRQGDALRFGYSSSISPNEIAPRIWLQIIERVLGLGALAVRLSQWWAVRDLTLQIPEELGDYERTWLRHGLTMASRASHLQENREGRNVQLSLLALARQLVGRIDCLRPDGIGPDDEKILTSLAQFDLLSGFVAIEASNSPSGRDVYPNFARVRQERIDPIVDRLLKDSDMRTALGAGDDHAIARTLAGLGNTAEKEGFNFEGFRGWNPTVEAYIQSHDDAA